ncbi:MAG: C25 family cysteine peptidase [Bacteroidales bacterium]|nr:C25 family cysteine peptidase [Bacteroidales bacterium]
MKKHFVLTFMMAAIGFGAMAQTFAVKQSSYGGVTLQFAAPKFKPQTFQYGSDLYSVPSMEGFGLAGVLGTPALPEMVKLVELPLGGEASVDIVQALYDTLPAQALGIALPIMPLQPSRSKNDTSPFVLLKDERAYATNTFYGNNAITVKNIGIARDRNLAEVHYMPLRYNPVTGQVILCKQITVSVSTQNADIASTQEMKRRYHSDAFASASGVANRLGNKEANHSAPLHYLIVANGMFRNQLNDFIAWKRRQGMLVTVGYTDDANVGSTSNSIKAYIKSFYTNATEQRPAPTFVLLVGDQEQLPESARGSQAGYTHISDLEYFTWTEGDYLPDCYYGRFSAQNLSQLTPQIEKTLMYEQYAFPNDNFLSRAALVSGVDAGYESDNAYQYCDPTMDYIAKLYVNSGNGFDTIAFYKNNISQNTSSVAITGSSQSSSAANELAHFYNNGFGWVNYSAHGDIDQWYQPNFTNSSVAQMTNKHKFGVMIGNCCLTNHFNTSECFGEALLRKDDYKGAVAYVGGSNVTFWYEDFCWAVGTRDNNVIGNTYDAPYDGSRLGAYDRLFHTHNEDFADWNVTMGSVIHSGNMAVQASSSSLANYYWHIYHLMGDPSLMPWLGKARTMAVDAPTTILSNLTSITVTAVPHAYIALTSGDSLLSAAFADANGLAVLNLSPIAPGTPVELAASAQNYKPFFQNISVITPEGPYVVVDSVSTTLLSGTRASLDVHLNNLGAATATNIGVQISVNGTHLLNLSPTRHNYPAANNIAANSTVTLSSADSVFVWPNVANGTATAIAVTVFWNSNSEEMSSSRTCYKNIAAPAIKATMSTTGNTITITNDNQGTLPFGNGTATLTAASSDINIANNVTATPAINAGTSSSLQFQLSPSGALPEGYNIPLDYTLTDGTHTYHTTFMLHASSHHNAETFESGDFSSFNWSHNAHPWLVDSTNSRNGRYCARSYTFGENAGNMVSSMTLQWTSTIDDSISYYRKVSSEPNYDLFFFYIDGALVDAASGEENWTYRSFPVPAGTHTFKFSYEKDYSYSQGSDCAWVDDINLPSNVLHRYFFDTICQGSNLVFADTTLSTATLSAGVHAYTFSKGGVTYHLSLTVNAMPNVTIRANNTDVQRGEAVHLVANGAEHYVWSTGEQAPELCFVPTSTRIYSVYGHAGKCVGSASIKITVDGDTTGIRNANHVEKATLFPNPATDRVTLSSTLPLRKAILYNVQGQMVAQIPASSNSLSISLAEFGKGVYLMKVVFDDGSSQTLKVIKR